MEPEKPAESEESPEDPKQPLEPPQPTRKTRRPKSSQSTPQTGRASQAHLTQPAGRDPPLRARRRAAQPDRDARREAAYRRLGTRQPKCQECGETDPLALQGVAPDLLCAECAARQAGRSPTENHHLAGQHNDPTTAPIPTNDHKVLNDLQRDWPQDTLRNREGSPLLRAAGTLRGWLDVLRAMIERTVGWIPGMLESLDAWLGEQLGERWWHQWGWQPPELGGAA